MILNIAKCLMVRLNSFRDHLSSVLLNEALAVSNREQTEMFINVLLAFHFSGFFFLELCSWVYIYSL